MQMIDAKGMKGMEVITAKLWQKKPKEMRMASVAAGMELRSSE
ncbi:unnamed protein product [Brassica oleracea var. botrytis]